METTLRRELGWMVSFDRSTRPTTLRVGAPVDFDIALAQGNQFELNLFRLGGQDQQQGEDVIDTLVC